MAQPYLQVHDSTQQHGLIHWFLATLSLSLLYLAAGVVSLLQSQHDYHLLPIWLPAGVALAFVHLYGLRVLPGIAIGATALSQLQGIDPLFCTYTAIGNMLEAVFASLLLRHYQFRTTLSRMHDVMLFLGIATIAAPLFSASFYTLLTYHTGSLKLFIGKLWLLKWLSSSMGIMILGTFFLTWRTLPVYLHKPQRLLELAALLVMLALVTQISLSEADGLSATLLLFPIVPMAAFAALRFGQHGITISMLMLTLLMVTVGSLHTPIFNLHFDLRVLLILIALLWVTAVTGLIVAAAYTEHNLSERLTYLASHDALTQLVNRNEFETRLRRAIDSAKEQGLTHTVLSMDLDRLKMVNDTCGHASGDELLRQVTGLFKNKVRKRDTVARLGGDEFAILLEHCSRQQGYEVAYSICESLEKFSFHCKGRSFNVGVSIGLVTVDNTSSGVHDLLANADEACYVAKAMGGGRVQMHDDPSRKSDWHNNTATWASALSAGLDNNQLCLHYQSIHAIGAGASARGQQQHMIELLVRGNNDGDLLPPSAFLPTAERNQLMADLDRWVLNSALQWISRHEAETRTISWFSINISLQSIKDENMLNFVLGRLRKYQINPRRLCFEISEESLNSNHGQTSHFVSSLKKHGCHFVLDRFNNSSSSLANLRDQQFEFVKLDPRLTRYVLDDSVDCAVLASLLDIARLLNLRAIATHVEDEQVYLKLQSLGVEYAQGFYLSRPKPLS